MIQYDPHRWSDHLFDVKGSLIIEEIGVEIENPFGNDLNDLALEELCGKIAQNTLAISGHRREAGAHVVGTSEVIKIGAE
jgi:predicted membrane chloride channel (bestrophin family)